jgi:hypothetical protein
LRCGEGVAAPRERGGMRLLRGVAHAVVQGARRGASAHGGSQPHQHPWQHMGRPTAACPPDQRPGAPEPGVARTTSPQGLLPAAPAPPPPLTGVHRIVSASIVMPL